MISAKIKMKLPTPSVMEKDKRWTPRIETQYQTPTPTNATRPAIPPTTSPTNASHSLLKAYRATAYPTTTLTTQSTTAIADESHTEVVKSTSSSDYYHLPPDFSTARMSVTKPTTHPNDSPTINHNGCVAFLLSIHQPMPPSNPAGATN